VYRRKKRKLNSLKGEEWNKTLSN
jgi:hypothetical protein